MPRRLGALPLLSVTIFVAGGIAKAAGSGNAWIVLVSGGGLMILWLIIAGAWLLFTPREARAPAPLMAQAPSG